jgi:2-dehydro-3-deoxygalactonokinase
MRGEEVQVFGLLDSLPEQGRHIICLPGIHTKWVEVVDGIIKNFYTFMTGELASSLSQQTLLSVLMKGTQYCPNEFNRGLSVGRESEKLLSDIFSVRSQGIMGNISEIGLSSYLLGILVGNEFKTIMTLFPGLKKFVVASSPWMYDMYQQACELFELEMEYTKSDSATVQGLFKIFNQMKSPAIAIKSGNRKVANQR